MIDFVVSVGQHEFGVIEGGLLEADAWVGEVFEKFDDLCDFGWVPLEVRDAVNVRVEVMDIGMFKVGTASIELDDFCE